MQGFITESASKLSDGIGGTLTLVATAIGTSLFFIPVTNSSSLLIKIAYISLLLLAGFYFLYRSLTMVADDTRRATSGMLSGLLLWQVLRFSGVSAKWGMLDGRGYLLWLAAVLVVGILWKKAFPLGLRFLVLLLLLNWLGSLYVSSGALLRDWTPLWADVFRGLRYLGAAGIAVSTWFILFKSGNCIQRKYGAAVLYFFVLLTFLLF